MAHKKKKKIKLTKLQQILVCAAAVVILVGLLLLCRMLDAGGPNPGQEQEGETLPPAVTVSVEAAQ